MKHNKPRTGKGNRSEPQDRHCAHRNLGRGRGAACSYGRRRYEDSSRSLTSIMSSVFGRMLDLADRFLQRLPGKIQTTHLPGAGSRKLEASLPELKLGREDSSRLPDNNRKLPQNHEESHLIADKQK